MKFFLDTADVAAIKEINELGVVDGVTTTQQLFPVKAAILKRLFKKSVRL